MVIEGGQRLAALQALAKSGEINADAPVPVVIEESTDAQARETSLATNIVRHAMHPVDEFRAFAALHANKETPLDADAIALRFGISRKAVEQRLALGNLDDAILDAWRDGKLNGDAAEAFTLCPNKKAQATIYAKLAKQGRIDRWDVKQALKIGHDNPGRLLNIIGSEAYASRGGKVTTDLFGSDHVASDPALLKAMVEEKLAETCKALTDAGWAWAMSEVPQDQYNYRRLDAKPASKEQAKALDTLRTQYDALEERGLNDESPEAVALELKIEALESEIEANAYSPAQKAKGGCFVSLNHRGDAIEIRYGQVKPQDRKAEKNAASGKDGEKKPKKPAALSNALSQRLRLQLLKATRAALVADKQSGALATMLAQIVASQIDINRPYGLPHEVEHSLTKIRDGITAKVMNEHQRKAFDSEDYFAGAPKAFTLKAIAEAVGAEHASKLAGKKRSEIAKFATANVTKTGWLPKELRTANYDGPQKKAPAKGKKR